jgi:histidyl-tRNA synthetase
LVPDAYAIVPNAAAVPMVLQTLQALRGQGVSVQMHASAGSGADGMGSMKSQFKKADASGARFALIFGETELASGCVAVKPLRGSKVDAEAAPEQSLRKLDEAATWAAILRG